MGGLNSKNTSETSRREFLNTKLGDLLEYAPSTDKEGSHQLVKVNLTDSVEQVLKTLRENNVSSAPVSSKTVGSDYGIIDTLDLVAFLGLTCRKMGKEEFIAQSKDIFYTSCEEIMNFSNVNPVISVQRTASVGEVIQEMDKQRIHRVVILDKQGNIEQLVTQSFLVETIYVSLDMLHPNPDMTLQEVGLADRKNLVCCNSQDITIEACIKMHEHGFTGIGVVNNEGVIVGCLGSNAMRNIGIENIDDLMLPVRAFLKKQNSLFLSCAPSATFRSVFQALVTYRLHRIFVVDDGKKPITVITLSDLLIFMMNLKDPTP